MKVFNVGQSNGFAPIQFALSGKNSADEPLPEPIVFTCLPQIQGRLLTDMIMASQEGEVSSLPHIERLVRGCLTQESEDRFDAITTGKDIIVELDLLGGIMQYLVEEYGKRPTAAPSDSQTGPSPMVPTSTANSGQPDLTPGANPSIDSSMLSTPPSSMTVAN